MKKKRKKVHETSPSSLKERSSCDLLHNSRIGIYKKTRAWEAYPFNLGARTASLQPRKAKITDVLSLVVTTT